MITRKLAFKLNRIAEYLTKPGARQAAAILAKSESLEGEAFDEWQNRAFSRLIRHSYESVPYYRRVMDKLSLTPQDFSRVEDVAKLPLLTKDIIRREGDRLKSSSYKGLNLIISKSGGTTGEPIESLLDEREYYLEAYTYHRGLQWMGWKPGMGTLKLFGGSLGFPTKKSWKSRLRDHAFGVLFIPAFEINRNNFNFYWRRIIRNGENIIIGYASAIYNLACLAEEILGPHQLSKAKLKYAFFTAEVMDPMWAEKIRKVLGCEVKGFYGCGEVNSLGFQVEDGAPYIVPSDHVILESVEDNGIANHITATPLYNYAKPLIRYVNGDLGEVEPPQVKSKYPKLKNFAGRSADMFLKEDGSRTSSILGTHSILKSRIPVKKYQYIQKEVDLVEMRYQMDGGQDLTNEQRQQLTRIFKDYLGQQLQMEFVRTNDFVVSKNAKHRIMISHV